VREKHTCREMAEIEGLKIDKYMQRHGLLAMSMSIIIQAKVVFERVTAAQIKNVALQIFSKQ
jgi:hypothetical protein